MQWAGMNPKAVALQLYNWGQESTIYARREEGGDRLNNGNIVFEDIGITPVFAHWGGATDEEIDGQAGEYNKVTPTFIFPIDSDIEDDAHVFYDEIEYEITATTRRGNHITSSGKQKDVLSNENSNVELRDGSLPVEQ